MGAGAKPPGHRVYLLQAAIRFVRAAAQLRGVRQISLLGSVTTSKPNPKDIDLLVVVSSDADIAGLATQGRRLKAEPAIGKSAGRACGSPATRSTAADDRFSMTI